MEAAINATRAEEKPAHFQQEQRKEEARLIIEMR
jgi:hypothetical protein